MHYNSTHRHKEMDDIFHVINFWNGLLSGMKINLNIYWEKAISKILYYYYVCIENYAQRLIGKKKRDRGRELDSLQTTEIDI